MCVYRSEEKIIEKEKTSMRGFQTLKLFQTKFDLFNGNNWRKPACFKKNVLLSEGFFVEHFVVKLFKFNS